MNTINRRIILIVELIFFIVLITLLMCEIPLFGIPENIWNIARNVAGLVVIVPLLFFLLWIAIRVPSQPLLLLFACGFIPLIILLYTFIYQHCALIGPNGNEYKDFLNCLYFSIITITTVGYGDFRPTPLCRMFAASEALLGYILLGLLVGAIIRVMQKKPKDIDENDFKDLKNIMKG